MNFTLKNWYHFPFLLMALLAITAGCKKSSPGIVTDIDGNVYHTVTIGKQVWMVENLKVTKYRNGDLIPNVTGRIQWSSLTTGAYCNYDNNDSGAAGYGRLYNWYAIKDNRSIAPEGWHIATDEDFKVLIDYLGGEAHAGGKMKAAGNKTWLNPNNDATNESGFTALPGGYRNNHYATFHLRGNNAYFWTATEFNDTTAWIRQLSNNHNEVFRNYADKASGFSIRCVMD